METQWRSGYAHSLNPRVRGSKPGAGDGGGPLRGAWMGGPGSPAPSDAFHSGPTLKCSRWHARTSRNPTPCVSKKLRIGPYRVVMVAPCSHALGGTLLHPPGKPREGDAAGTCQVGATRRCRQQNWRHSVLAACRVRGPGVWSEPQQETLVPQSRRPPQGPPPSSCCWLRTTDPWDLRAGIATAPLRLQRPRERPRESLQPQALSGPPSGRAPMSPAVGPRAARAGGKW